MVVQISREGWGVRRALGNRQISPSELRPLDELGIPINEQVRRESPEINGNRSLPETPSACSGNPQQCLKSAQNR